ncbi:glycosyltransferase family 2 protein [Spirillospora sp. CA-128828]|uniref:glycosyltransferase family 2 protein n=1 Tax=Spirillospora sp. CA-128828 TaxID=3240033 RepID=UPI003D8B1FD6
MAADPRKTRSRPLVSVVIPTLNRADTLDAALHSVMAAGRRLSDDVDAVEAVVVNDGGRSVGHLVETWERRLPLTVVELDRCSGGASVPRNVAIEAAQGEYIAFLDDDDIFLPQHLAVGCEPLRKGDADFVYSGAVVSERRLDALPADLSGYRLKAYPYDPRFLMVANYLHTGAIIVRNFRHTQVRFDPDLDVCEDWDLWIALTTVLRYRVTFVDEITSVYHQVPDTSGMVSGAQLISPSKFAMARDYINAKWPVADPVVEGYRAWTVALERYRDDLIARHRRMPNLLFDEILGYLHERISRRLPPDHAHIGRFFTSVAAPVGPEAIR